MTALPFHPVTRVRTFQMLDQEIQQRVSRQVVTASVPRYNCLDHSNGVWTVVFKILVPAFYRYFFLRLPGRTTYIECKILKYFPLSRNLFSKVSVKPGETGPGNLYHSRAPRAHHDQHSQPAWGPGFLSTLPFVPLLKFQLFQSWITTGIENQSSFLKGKK